MYRKKAANLPQVLSLGLMGRFVVEATFKISLYFSHLGIKFFNSYYNYFLKIIVDLIAKFVFLLLFLYRKNIFKKHFVHLLQLPFIFKKLVNGNMILICSK